MRARSCLPTATEGRCGCSRTAASTKASAGSGAQVTRTAQWNGENLETAVELPLPTPVPRSLTVHQTYEVQDGADGGRQLVVTSRIEGPARRLRAGDRELRRVYDDAGS